MNMKALVACLTVIVFSGCMAPYDDLEQKYAAKPDTSSPGLGKQTVVLISTKHRGAFTFREMMTVRLALDHVELTPEIPFNLFYKPVRIPLNAINGCGKTCFGSPGPFHADLLLGDDGVEISVDQSEEVLAWCWETGLPMISGKTKRNWMYDGQPLPSSVGYVQVTKEEYALQTKSRCMGY